MTATLTIAVLAVIYLVSALLAARHIRRQRKRQTYPALFVVKDDRLDIKPAVYRRRRP